MVNMNWIQMNFHQYKLGMEKEMLQVISLFAVSCEVELANL